jgi:hypothetical protein
MYGDMQGIVGAALPPIGVLELPAETEGRVDHTCHIQAVR